MFEHVLSIAWQLRKLPLQNCIILLIFKNKNRINLKLLVVAVYSDPVLFLVRQGVAMIVSPSSDISCCLLVKTNLAVLYWSKLIPRNVVFVFCDYVCLFLGDLSISSHLCRCFCYLSKTCMGVGSFKLSIKLEYIILAFWHCVNVKSFPHELELIINLHRLIMCSSI